ncbi:hypothetical protein, partial [Parafrankia elaeagni]|uniref:hypothetical protein n=1 Tax=Parafrankia elaeagni TaxID=222534 RepID=UPI00037BD85F
MAGTGSSASTSAGGAADIGGLDGPTPHDLLPTTDSHPEETVRYQTVVLTDMPGAVASRELKGTVNLGRDDLSVYDRPAEGMIITTEQSWTVEGVTLGRLLHSLSLAPGECTKVAVVGWERRTRGDGDETTVEGDALTSGTTQDRSISELANMIAREEQHGLSRTVEAGHSDSAGASGGLALFGASLGGSWSTSSNAGIATSVARTTGTRDVAAQVAQRISSRTGQLATVARSRQTTVVRETSQTEREQVSTRLVTNYNHMHAMSMQYYEVIHVYKVLTRTRTVERCLFVPLQELGFTPSNVKYFRALLAKAAPPAWAARIRAIDPFETVVRRLDGATATAATGPVRYDTTKLLDLSGSPRAPYGVRSDGVPVRFDLATRQWKALPTTGLPRAGLKKIAAAGDAVWGVDAENFVVQYLAPTWQRSRNDARDVSCGTDGSVYMIGVRGYLHRRTDSWLNLGFLAESVAVANRDRVWSCRQGKTWEVGGTGRVERESPGIVRMTGASDGSVWGMTRDFKIYSVVPGASTWTSATVDGTGMATYSKVGISDGRELWLLDVNGNAVQIASRGTLTAFDHPPSPDAGWAVRLEVWWDHAGIRGVRLTMPGTSGTHTEGVTSPDLSYATHTFKAGDRLLQVDYWTGAAAGGCLSGLRLTTQAGPIAFGPAADSSTPPAVTEDTGSVALCGFHGSTVKSTENVTYIASLGFYGRADSAPQAVLDHLNDNSRFYSQAVWVNADELTLSRVLANYHYAPSGETDA